MGATWYLIAGRIGTAFARGGRADTSFQPVTSRPATGVDNRSFIFRIGGINSNGTRVTSSFMSYDGGQSWTDMATRTGAIPFAPARDRANLIIDGADNLYLINGQMPSGAYTPTIALSRNQGFTWETLPNTPWGGRGTAVTFHHRSRRLNLEVFTYTTGWNGSRLHNDIWVSSDHARTWTAMPHGPFAPRDSANGEATSDGVLVLVGGQSNPGNTSATEEALNDVWVSMDGGWSWGQCLEDAAFTDRRDLLTVFDDQAFLYVAGGTDWWANPQRWFNDVWRSSFAFTNLGAVSAACGVSVPSCGVGLSCWPGSGISYYPNGSVSCPATRACAGLPEVALNFVQQSTGSWAPRWAANTELFPKAFTYVSTGGQTLTAPANSLILQGGTQAGNVVNNDIWLSADRGITWTLIAGYARTAAQGGEIRAGGTAWGTSYSPALSETVGIVDEVNGVLYRIGGYLSTATAVRNDVWRSTNAVAWTKMAATNLPPRWGANVVIDTKGKIFIVGGNGEGTTALRDMWVSTNNGATFTAPNGGTPPPFMVNNRGRSKALLLQRRSNALNRDVLYYGTGYNNAATFNDIWASSDEGVTWVPVTVTAPFPARDAAGAEITAAGLIVVSGGQQSLPVSEVLNDVWVSADGGYTWGQCIKDAAWADRREVTTVYDATENLLILAGRSGTGNTQLFNDVFRSSLSFNDLRSVQSACSISIPACGPGLTCWPGAPGTTFNKSHGVTCPVLEACKRGILPSSTGAPRPAVVPSSTAKPKPRPYDPCYDDYPVTDPDCETFEASTAGNGGSSSSTPPAWLILLIVALCVVVAVIGWGLWRRRAKAAQQGQMLLPSTSGVNDSLLLSQPPMQLSTS